MLIGFPLAIYFTYQYVNEFDDITVYSDSDINSDYASQPLDQLEGISETAKNNGLQSIDTSKQLTSADIMQLRTFRFASVDGQLLQDADGNLIVNRDLRHWIDFYLSATGELSLEQIIAVMQQEISLLESPGKEQALALLENYIGYKTALAEYDQREALSMTEVTSMEQVGERLDWQKRLRREWLDDDTVQEFFQLDEIVDDFAYQKLAIHTSELSADEKAQQTQQLEQELPAELIQFKKQIALSKDLMLKEQQLIKEGRADEIAQLRSETVSPEAVERLETVDQQHENWRSRVMNYSAHINEVESMEGVSVEYKQQLIQDYQAQHFGEREKLRLPAAVQLLQAENP